MPYKAKDHDPWDLTPWLGLVILHGQENHNIWEIMAKKALKEKLNFTMLKHSQN